MRWLRKIADGGSGAAGADKASLDAFAHAGVETVVFIAQTTGEATCEEARMLEGGRIPIKLAEPTPLAKCTEKASCACRYDEWPPLNSPAG